MANPYEEYFTSVADAIRARFGLTRKIYLSEFAHIINPDDYQLIEMDAYETYESYMGKVLTATSEAIRSYSGSTTAIYGKDIPNAIRNLVVVNYGSLTYASQSNVTWTSKPSVPSVSISQKSYTLTWEYTWSHSSYDKYKINSVTITPNNSSVYNPAYGSNIKSRPYGNDVVDSLYIRCSYSKTVDLSGLISNMQSWGAPESEILAEMRSELNSQISSVNQLAGTFSFNIGYYGGTYV